MVKSADKITHAQGGKVIAHRNPGDKWYGDHVWSMRNSHGIWEDYTHENFISLCPYGNVGDRLWGRESTLRVEEHGYGGPIYAESEVGIEILTDGLRPSPDDYVEIEPYDIKIRPSVHMPRDMARILLEITSIRVERLHDISEDDAKAEGLKCLTKDNGHTYKYGLPDRDGLPGSDNHGWEWVHWEADPRIAFKRLWQLRFPSHSREIAWNENPWVWVMEFKRV